ncbi:hypothetical protein PLESTB_001293100 [Pleodorina starrii]|uniref:Uncharacterized protein n=1 Tax=Pleodorina starrii TaxID=330485 RepID=A0A9W6BTT2_9CHLO|nr:hypothetical protein PLESTM_000955900 [Pleodorina starrii]GLC57948.1 hypothetical protein PLESTB_001293100 [Pleodorina starrii]
MAGRAASPQREALGHHGQDQEKSLQATCPAANWPRGNGVGKYSTVKRLWQRHHRRRDRRLRKVARRLEGVQQRLQVHDLESLLDTIQPPSDLPEAPVPPAVVALPKPFQLQALEWMMRREQRGGAIGRSLLL